MCQLILTKSDRFAMDFYQNSVKGNIGDCEICFMNKSPLHRFEISNEDFYLYNDGCMSYDELNEILERTEEKALELSQ